MSKVFQPRFRARVRALACIALFVTGCDQGTLDPDAGADASAACTGDEACDDGRFCNGVESCVGERCAAGTAPCAAAPCDEAARTCDVDCDVDGDSHDSIACGGDDCDDEDPTRFPSNTEVCEPGDVDEDCEPTTFGDRDADGDGHVSDECCNVTADRTRRCGEDCDDTTPGANSDVPEVCDTSDNDCDGAIDEGVRLLCYVDEDGDGYALADAASFEICACPVRTTSRPPGDAADCDDTLADVSPGSPEICGNGRNDDCDGTIDEAGNDWYPDCDGDGFGAGTPVRECASPGTPLGCPGGGHELRDGDCDDDDDDVYPGAPEICDGVPNDCASSTTDGPVATAWCTSREAPPHVEAQTCEGGVCGIDACEPGFDDCNGLVADGCETDLSALSSCGTCGLACRTGHSCVDGHCLAVPQPGSWATPPCRTTGDVVAVAVDAVTQDIYVLVADWAPSGNIRCTGVSYDGGATFATRQTTLSAEGGSTWEDDGHLSAYDGVLAYGDDSQVFYSFDGGASWALRPAGSFASTAVSDAVLWANGTSIVRTTADAADVSVALSPVPGSILRMWWDPEGERAWASARRPSSSDLDLYYSDDLGVTWSFLPLPDVWREMTVSGTRLVGRGASTTPFVTADLSMLAPLTLPCTGCSYSSGSSIPFSPALGGAVVTYVNAPAIGRSLARTEPGEAFTPRVASGIAPSIVRFAAFPRSRAAVYVMMGGAGITSGIGIVTWD